MAYQDVLRNVDAANEVFKAAGVQFWMRSFERHFLPSFADLRKKQCQNLPGNQTGYTQYQWSSVRSELQQLFPWIAAQPNYWTDLQIKPAYRWLHDVSTVFSGDDELVVFISPNTDFPDDPANCGGSYASFPHTGRIVMLQADVVQFFGPNIFAHEPECEFNTRFDPKPYEPGPPRVGVCPIGTFDLDVNPDHPGLCVDFCDALMFCGWAGKRLCSMPGVKPGTVHTVKPEDIATTIGSDENEWRNACSQGGKTKFPYGDEYVPGACIDVPRVSSEGTQALAGKAPEPETCHGAEPPYDEVFQFSGSVSEWVNVCEGSCAISGGSWSQLGSVEDVNAFACDGAHTASRSTVDPHNGIRCCADAVGSP